MARFEIDPDRVNFTVQAKGKEYNLRLLQRSKAIFAQFLRLLPSNYVSSVEGPTYTIELKAVAVELARIELAIEDVNTDIDLSKTRSEFVWAVLGRMLFLDDNIPALEHNDVAFREFLVSLLRIYLKGSIPEAIREAVDLLMPNSFEVLENFLLTRAGASGFDISDQFGFQVVIDVTGESIPDLFDIQSSLRIILDVIRPAHTLFTLRYRFHDTYEPNDEGEILDAMRWALADYYYDDVRKYWGGIRDRDRLGQRRNRSVTDEDHSADF